MNLKSPTTRFAYIYTLSDPRTNEVRYVGKAFDLRVRLYTHLYERKDAYKNRRAAWIKSLKQIGLKPIIFELERFPIEEVKEWQEAEKFWIQTLRFYGCRLTNHERGGGGRSHLEYTRLKLSRIGRKRVHSPETRAKISASCKARMTEDEKQRLREKSLGFRHDEATKRIISESKKGKSRPPHVLAALKAGHLKWRASHFAQ